MDAQLRALVEPRRREILKLIRDQEMAAGDIAGHFDVTRPAISQHLSVLLEAGLISERRQGTRRLYRARPEGVMELQQYLDDLWGGRLRKLKTVIEAAHGQENQEHGNR